MISKTPNIHYFVAKTHLSRFMVFFFLRQQIFASYRFGGRVAHSGHCLFFVTVFFAQGLPSLMAPEFTNAI